MAYGQLLVGLALILGLLTRVTAVFGLAMSLAFTFSGSVSTNPQVIMLQLAIIALGSGAGAYGLDRWVLPWVRELAGPRLVRAWKAGAIAVGVAFAAFLTRIANDTGGWETWAVAVLVAVGAAALFRWQGGTIDELTARLRPPATRPRA